MIKERVAVEKTVVEEQQKILDTEAFAGADREKQVAVTLAEKDAQEALIQKIKEAEAAEADQRLDATEAPRMFTRYVAIAALSIAASAAEYPVLDKPIMQGAHRGGARAGYPENCIATFEHTLEHTFAMMEIDPRYTKDGTIVLHHDARLERTTNGKGLVADFTLQELKRARQTIIKENPADLTKDSCVITHVQFSEAIGKHKSHLAPSKWQNESTNLEKAKAFLVKELEKVNDRLRQAWELAMENRRQATSPAKSKAALARELKEAMDRLGEVECEAWGARFGQINQDSHVWTIDSAK